MFLSILSLTFYENRGTSYEEVHSAVVYIIVFFFFPFTSRQSEGSIFAAAVYVYVWNIDHACIDQHSHRALNSILETKSASKLSGLIGQSFRNIKKWRFPYEIWHNAVIVNNVE